MKAYLDYMHNLHIDHIEDIIHNCYSYYSMSSYKEDHTIEGARVVVSHLKDTRKLTVYITLTI